MLEEDGLGGEMEGAPDGELKAREKGVEMLVEGILVGGEPLLVKR